MIAEDKVVTIAGFVVTQLRQGLSHDAVKTVLAQRDVSEEFTQAILTIVDFVATQLRHGVLVEEIQETAAKRGVSKPVVAAVVDQWLGKKVLADPDSILPPFDEVETANTIQAEGIRHLQTGRQDLAVTAMRKLSVFNKNLGYELLETACFYAPDEGSSPSALLGHDYFHVLKHIHACLQPRNYLEIGVNYGNSIILTSPNTRAVGVDPTRRTSWAGMPSHIQLYAMTSDDFFAQMDLNILFNGQPLDLAFIDGMHLFEYTLRDFIHVERHCHPNSIVLFHDTYPVDSVVAARTQFIGHWVGDPWKILPCLKKYRPDLEFHTIAVKPSGLTVVRNLDPNNRILRDNLKEIYAEFVCQDFIEHQKNIAANVNAFPVDLARISNELLAGIQWGP